MQRLRMFLAVVFGLGLVAATPAQEPNLRLAVSVELANLAGVQKVDRVERLDEVILGTRLRGLGRVQGAVHVEFVPSDAAAAIDLVLTATNVDLVNSIGINGPVNLISKGEVALVARKRVFLTAQGITTAPAIADADPQSNLVRIDTQFHGHLDRLIRSIATTVYNRDRDKGVAVGRALAIDRIRESFDKEVESRIAESEFAHGLPPRLVEPLQRRGVLPRRLQFLTDPGYLHVLAAVGDPDDAPVEPPPAFPPGTQAAGWVHESLPNGLLTRALGGKKLGREEINRELGKLLGDRLPAPPPDPDAEPFTLLFAKKRPIAVSFRDGFVVVTIRTEAFETADSVYEGPAYHMDTTLKYGLRLDGRRVVGERVGEVTVLPTGFEPGKRMSARQTALARLMRNQFERSVPGRFQADALFPTPAGFTSVGRLTVERIVSRQGWLAASVRWVPPVLDGR